MKYIGILLAIIINLHAALSHEYKFNDCILGDYLKDTSRKLDLSSVGNVTVGSLSRCSYIQTLNGSYLYSSFGHTNQLSRTKNASITVWIKPTSLNNSITLNGISNMFFSIGDNEDKIFELGISSNGKLMVHSLRDSKKNKEALFLPGISNDIKLNEWNFIAITFDEGVYSFTINQSKYTLNDSEIIRTARVNLSKIYIGGNSESYFNGSIDNVRVYNHTLSDTEIADLYNENEICPCPLNLPIIHYYLDECIYSTPSNIVVDNINGINGVGYNLLSEPGVLCQAASFNGDSRIEIENNTIIENFSEFTYHFQIKPTHIQSSTLFEKQKNTDGYRFFLNNNILFVNINGFNYFTGVSLTLNGWNNIGISFKDNVLKIYKENVMVSNIYIFSFFWNDFITNAQLVIGEGFIGQIDEIKYYDKENLNFNVDTRTCVSCENPINTTFNIVDINDSDDINGLLHTKLSGEDYSYQLQCLNDSEFTDCIIEKIELIDSACNCSKHVLFNGFLNINETQNINLQIPFSYKDATFKITGRTSTGETKESFSQVFSVKPFSFASDIDSALVAEKDYNTTITAVTKSGITDIGFSDQVNINVSKILIGENADFLDGELIHEAVVFNAGISNFNFYYTNIGDVTLNLFNSNWVNDSLFIEHKIPVTFYVDYFLVEGSASLINFQDKFTYYGELEDIYGKIAINLNVTARGNKNGLMTNYALDKYSYNDLLDVNISLPGEPLLESNYSETIFLNGLKTYSNTIKINYQRGVSLVKEPLKIDSQNLEINATLHNDFNIQTINNISIDSFLQFYYGKFIPDFLTTTENVGIIYPKVLIYSTTDIGFQEILSNWYVNYHDNVNSILNQKFTIDSNYLSAEQTVSDELSFLSGIFTEKIGITEQANKTIYIHYDVPDYLWFNEYNIEYNALKDCSTHPCSIVNFQLGEKSLETGTPDGSVLKTDDVVNNKSGIKLFRE